MITLNKQWVSLGNTCIPNNFLIDFMPVAKSEYVKVYLYGLMYAQNAQQELSLQLLASELGMNEEDIMQAFSYWERRKLVIRIQDKPLKYEYVPISIAVANKLNNSLNSDYIKFSDGLYAQFGEKRRLHGSETSLAYEWVEELKIPAEIVMMLIQHMISTVNINFSFKSAQKLALKLKEDNINTVEMAEHFFSVSEKGIKGAKSVLTRFRKYRQPTEDEINLYLKWTEDLGLSNEAILEACKETTKGDASFAYLDAILASFVKRSKGNIGGAADINFLINNESEVVEESRSILQNLGMGSAKRNVTKGIKDTFISLKQMYPYELISYAAYIVGQRGGKFDALLDQLNLWKSRGIENKDQAIKFVEKTTETDALLRKIYDGLALAIVPNANDRKQLQTWQIKYSFSPEMYVKCAEYAKGKQVPFQYMNSVLEAWNAKGLNTIIMVEEAHKNYTNSKGTQSVKKVNAQNYTQRVYAESEYNIWIPDVDDEVKNNE